MNEKNVKLEIKVNGHAVENFRYRSYAQKAEVTPDQATRIIKACEAILDEPEAKKA